MTDDAGHAAHANESLARWLVTGLVVGCIVLGLLIGAYSLGYHRGRGHGAKTTPAAGAPATTTAPAATTTAPAAAGPVTATPALVARGKQLFTADSCAGCHSLSGAAGAGPALNGLAGAGVKLTTGQTVTADDAYLARSITDPNAAIVSGYRADIMSAAVAGFGLGAKPDDVKALVAFIKSRH